MTSSDSRVSQCRHKDSISVRVYNLVLGATVWYGLEMNALMVHYLGGAFNNIDLRITLILYFISVIIGSLMANNSTNPFVSFIGYNFIVVPIGVLLTICVPAYPVQMIELAAVITASATILMILLATIRPSIFAGLGSTLSVALLSGIIIEIVFTLFGYRGDFFNWLFVLIFLGYIGYDWYKAQSRAKTLDNAVDSAVEIYLDIINLFLRLLEILGDSKKSRR